MILASSLGRMFWTAWSAGSISGTCAVVGTPTVRLAYSSAKKSRHILETHWLGFSISIVIFARGHGLAICANMPALSALEALHTTHIRAAILLHVSSLGHTFDISLLNFCWLRQCWATAHSLDPIPTPLRHLRGKGAARDLEAGYCLTLRSEATRKDSWKAPRMPQKPPAKAPRGSWSQATASRMQQKPVARAPRGIWRQATA